MLLTLTRWFFWIPGKTSGGLRENANTKASLWARQLGQDWPEGRLKEKLSTENIPTEKDLVDFVSLAFSSPILGDSLIGSPILAKTPPHRPSILRPGRCYRN